MWSLQCRCPNHHVICVPDVRFAFIGSNIATTTECQIECPLCIADSSSTLNKRDWWHFHVSNLKPWIKHWRYRAHNKTQYNSPCSNNDFKTGIYYMQMFTAFASSKPTNNMFQACILFVYFRSFSALCLATMWTKYITTNPKKGRMHHVVDFLTQTHASIPALLRLTVQSRFQPHQSILCASFAATQFPIFPPGRVQLVTNQHFTNMLQT